MVHSVGLYQRKLYFTNKMVAQYDIKTKTVDQVHVGQSSWPICIVKQRTTGDECAVVHSNERKSLIE